MGAAATHLNSTIDDQAVADPSRRLLAWVVDAFILGVLETPLKILYSRRPSGALLLGLVVPSLVLGFVYLVLFDGGTRGATPGKRIVGTRVVDAETGQAIGYSRAVVRRVVYILGGLLAFLGWMWLLIDKRRQAWHDHVARSVVIKSR
jgi:uncharacterized RDD family membrane protein YckC